MTKGQSRATPAPRNEHERGLRYFLAVAFGALAIVDALIEYRTGNRVVMVATATIAILTFAILVVTRGGRYARLPVYYALGVLFVLLILGGLTQWHLSSNLVWIPLYPFGFYLIGGLRAGMALSLLGLIGIATGYAAHPQLHVTQPVSLNHFVQVAFAYGMSALIAHIYEHIRTRQQAQLTEQAVSDYLTGLPNRRGFFHVTTVLVEQARRLRQPFAVIVFDLDNFKSVNDQFGHAAGDELLRQTARLVQDQLRKSDVLARWGGEEFVALLPHSQTADAALVAEKLRDLLAGHPFPVIGRVTASFGVAAQRNGDDMDQLIGRADAALYRAKHAGKNRVELAI